MNNNTQTTSGGIGFLGLLTILFIGLKLGDIIAWSWWFVLLPAYALPAIGIMVLLGLGVAYAVVSFIDFFHSLWIKQRIRNLRGAK